MNSHRTLVITGASRGLGRALVERFAEDDHNVLVGCGRSAEAVASLSSKFPAPHRFDVVDVADDAQVAAWCAAVTESMGAPDLLLNNAALINRNAALWQVPLEEFSAVIDVNIKGVYHVIRHFLPSMIEAGRGVVVNFSSGWGRSTAAEVAPYCATKYAMEGLTGALAAELPSGMAAVAVNPGIIHTEMLDSCFGAGAASFPTPESWSLRAAPFLLKLNAADNGASLSVP